MFLLLSLGVIRYTVLFEILTLRLVQHNHSKGHKNHVFVSRTLAKDVHVLNAKETTYPSLKN